MFILEGWGRTGWVLSVVWMRLEAPGACEGSPTAAPLPTWRWWAGKGC